MGQTIQAIAQAGYIDDPKERQKNPPVQKPPVAVLICGVAHTRGAYASTVCGFAFIKKTAFFKHYEFFH